MDCTLSCLAVLPSQEGENVSKPPLGIKPRMLWLQSRRDEIYNALFRYFAVDKPIPVEWIEEILEIEKSIQKDKVKT